MVRTVPRDFVQSADSKANRAQVHVPKDREHGMTFGTSCADAVAVELPLLELASKVASELNPHKK